jgi:hypothetical protein
MRRNSDDLSDELACYDRIYIDDELLNAKKDRQGFLSLSDILQTFSHPYRARECHIPSSFLFVDVVMVDFRGSFI